MSSEFYLKAHTLYEEFQKKELQYLNAERKLTNTLMLKKDHNVPLQEYLQSIHQREKKSEETYQSIMEQMNKLDQHTDLLFLKLEKLGIFRNIQDGHNLKDTNFPPSLRYTPQNVNTLQNKQEPTVSHFDSHYFQSSTLKSASTQTEDNIYCDKCRFPIRVSSQSNQSVNESTSSFVDIFSVSKDESQVLDLLRSQNDSFKLLHNNNNDSQFITSSLNTEHVAPQVYQNINEKDSKNELVTNEKYEAKPLDDSTTLEEKELSLQSSNTLVADKILKGSENKEILTESKPNDSGISAGVSAQKSDKDSVNREFDFLELDTADLKTKNQKFSKNNTTAERKVNKSTGHVAHSEMRFPSNSSMMLGQERDALQSNKEQEIFDNRSEISGSISGIPSPVISLSDSDSINEKGSFTASNAYQTLLGNAVMPSKTNKEISESEDEAEKTLARTVQKSNIKPKSKSAQPKKDKSASQAIDPKPDVKSKHVSVNKTQSKLSKSTKKVLGLDTSSSSEVEAFVKPPDIKKDEDSDEFGFYD